MGWYANVALYSHNQYENDRDEKLLSLVMEKVVLVKINGIVRAAYDPMSTSQTLKLTQLLGRLKGTYPTLTGASKQVRELLKAVMDKLKACVDHDVYIPLGYSKQ
jgi:GC-rich sequence DNA-binding factor